jgi:hypothetical protein
VIVIVAGLALMAIEAILTVGYIVIADRLERSK